MNARRAGKRAQAMCFGDYECGIAIAPLRDGDEMNQVASHAPRFAVDLPGYGFRNRSAMSDETAAAFAPRYPSPPPYYHGMRAGLKPGDLVSPGCASNYGTRKKANHVYFSATLDAAIWGAELAVGEGPGRIYIVEPTGPFTDDPNLTGKRFPGNPTKSYRSKAPLRVVGEVRQWQGHTAEQLKTMREHLERLKAQGIEAVDD